MEANQQTQLAEPGRGQCAAQAVGSVSRLLPDEQFSKELRQSHHAVEIVTEWLCSKGHKATANPLRITTDRQSRHLYSDDGDIVVEGKGRVEVKYHRHWTFTSRETMPFRQLIVDEKYQIDRRHSMPLLCYINVNGPFSHVAMIGASSKPHWQIRSVLDTRYNEQRTFYWCPKALVRFSSLKV